MAEENTTYIEAPTREGYVFSHWSRIKPGSYKKLRDGRGNVIGIENQCPPFDFEHETITNDTTLYAIYTPEVTATFVDYDPDTDTMTTKFTETVTPGKLIYDPVQEGEFAKYQSETVDEDEYSGEDDSKWVYRRDPTTGKPKFTQSENVTWDRQ